jgi:hypothetical protein
MAPPADGLAAASAATQEKNRRREGGEGIATEGSGNGSGREREEGERLVLTIVGNRCRTVTSAGFLTLHSCTIGHSSSRRVVGGRSCAGTRRVNDLRARTGEPVFGSYACLCCV